MLETCEWRGSKRHRRWRVRRQRRHREKRGGLGERKNCVISPQRAWPVHYT